MLGTASLLQASYGVLFTTDETWMWRLRSSNNSRKGGGYVEPYRWVNSQCCLLCSRVKSSSTKNRCLINTEIPPSILIRSFNESGIASWNSQASWLYIEFKGKEEGWLDHDPRSITWFLQLKEGLKILVNRYCSAIYKAMQLFEDKPSTSRHYSALQLIFEKTQEYG